MLLPFLTQNFRLTNGKSCLQSSELNFRKRLSELYRDNVKERLNCYKKFKAKFRFLQI